MCKEILLNLRFFRIVFIVSIFFNLTGHDIVSFLYASAADDLLNKVVEAIVLQTFGKPPPCHTCNDTQHNSSITFEHLSPLCSSTEQGCCRAGGLFVGGKLAALISVSILQRIKAAITQRKPPS